MIISKLYEDAKKRDTDVDMVGGIFLGILFSVVFLSYPTDIPFALTATFVIFFLVSMTMGLTTAGSCISTIIVLCGAFNFVWQFKLMSEVWAALVITVVLMELVFIFDKKKPKPKEDRMWFTIKRKFHSLCDVVVGCSLVGSLSFIVDTITEFEQELIQIIGVIGGLVVIGLLLYGYIKLNSLRYGKAKKK